MVKTITGSQLLQMLSESDGRALKSHPCVGPSSMPKIIHQAMATSLIEADSTIRRKSWLATYPDWTHVLWTKDATAALVKDRYPQYYELYDVLQRESLQSDLVRNMYVHTFGGIYVDLDFYSHKSIELVLEEHLQHEDYSVFLGTFAESHPSDKNRQMTGISNAFLASTPRHPFWLSVLDQFEQSWAVNEVHNNGKSAEEITGSFALHRAYQAWLVLTQATPRLGKSRAWASKQGYEYSHYMQNVLH